MDLVETIVLIITAFLTSILSAVMGMGGGILLLTVMMQFLPPKVLIPIHGIVQLFSNGFRVALNYKHLAWYILLPMLLGGVMGSALGSFVVVSLDNVAYQFVLAAFILYMTWGPKVKVFKMNSKIKFYVVGFMGHIISLIFGASGPFIAPFFLNENLSRFEIIASKAASQFAAHLLKVAIFFAIGVNLGPYAGLIVGMVVAVLLGTYLGKRILHKVTESWFLIAFKVLITLLCLRMLIMAFLQ